MAIIPKGYLDCVVAIGRYDETEESKRKWIASGFLYGHHCVEGTRKYYKVYIVTNRHVLQDLSSIYLRFNPQAAKPAREYEVPLVNKRGRPKWTGHPSKDVDVAVLLSQLKTLREDHMQVDYFRSNKNCSNVRALRDAGVMEGDSALVLGFPMGIVGEDRNAVILRGGPIARIQDALLAGGRTFLVDASVFPGNSGGPVLVRSEPSKTATLIGLVRSYVPYQDVAISSQTLQPRVVFEENSGLAAVHTVDCIEEAILADLKKRSHAKPIPREVGTEASAVSK